MAEPPKLAKATLQEIRWTSKGVAETKNPKGKETEAVTVQFNPQTLKVNYANQKAGGDQVAVRPSSSSARACTEVDRVWFDDRDRRRGRAGRRQTFASGGRSTSS